jgi:hypothetical protein
MTIILGAVAIIAIAAAVALGVFALRLKRAERAREDARVELLMKLAAEGQPADEPVRPFESTARTTAAVTRETADTSQEFEYETSASAALFATPDTASPWPNRLAAAAACAALIAAVGLIFAFGSGRDLMKADAVVSSRTPLELVALEHTQEGFELVIHGVVQNPQPSRTLRGVVASVALIGAGNADAGTMTTRVDGAALEPGQSAPFTVRVPLDRQVARYRVSFKMPDGRVIAHVDRRAPRSIARTLATEAGR